MKSKFIIGAFFFLSTAATAVAQDVNFSQINSMPLLLNPANTGNFDRAWRASGIFRNTTYAAGQTFTTAAFTIEKRITSGGLIGENDRLGIGFFGLSDQSNGGALKTNYMGFSTAYGKALNVSGTSRLSAGLQGVWVTRRLDLNKLTFADQFTSGGFENQVPSADAYKGASYSYLDLNAGIAYSLTKEKAGFNVGAAIYHATKPKEGFWSENDQLPSRYTLHAGAYFAVAEGDRIHLNTVNNFQGKADEHLFGAYFSKKLMMAESDLRLNIGSFYRLRSAIIPYLGIESRSWSSGFTYDVASGSIREGGANRKSFEVRLSAFF